MRSLSSLISRRRPAAWALAALLGSAALYACDDLLVNPRQQPGRRTSSLAVRLQLSAELAAGGAREAFDKANRLRVRVTRGEAAVVDTTVALAPAGQDTRLSLDVEPKAEGDSVGVSVSLLRDAAELFRGGARAALRTGQVVPVEVAIEPVAASISVPDSLGPLASVGDSVQLTGSLLFATGDTIAGGGGLAWASLDPGIADVVAGTKAVARGNGQARIVASSGAFRDTTLVRVRQVVRSIRTTAPTDTLLVGDTVTYGATPLDARQSPVADVPVTWMTTNAGVLDVSAAGLVTARGPGQGSVLAMAGGAGAELKVTVKSGAASVVGASGAVVSTPGDSVRLEIPAGALPSPVRIAISPQPTYPPSDRVAGTAYRFAPDGTRFATPATLTVRYDPARVPAGYPAGELRLHHTDGTGWDEVAGGTVDTAAHTVRGQIGGFSGYGVLARVPAASISVSPDSARLLPGRTVRLTATVKDAAGNTLADRPVAWASSDTAHVRVDSTGLVTGVRDGFATVTAASGPARGSAAITVVPTPAASVDVAPDSARLFVGQTVQLGATVRDSSGGVLAGRMVLWSTSNPAVASVTADGLVTAAGPGIAAVRGTSGAAYDSALVTVLAAPVFSRLVVTPDSAVLTAVGDTVRFSAAGQDQYGAPIAFPAPVWSTPDTSVVSVDAGTGLVRAHGGGTARVIATSGGFADTATVRVAQAAVSIEAAPDSAAIHDPGEPVSATAGVFDRNHEPIAGARPAFASSAPAVATVDSLGTIRGVADGTAVVRASLAGAAGDSILVRVQMVASVAVPASIDMLVGDSATLAAAALAANGDTIRGRAFFYSSSDIAVVRIDSATGVAHALVPGNAVVTAAQGTAGIHGTTTVNVRPAGVARVAVTPDSAYVRPGGTLRLNAKAFDAVGRELAEPLTWSSANGSVATVNATGLVTAVGVGDAAVFATAGNGVHGFALVRVAVPAAHVIISPDTATIVVSATRQLLAQAVDSGGATIYHPLAWRSSDTAVARVDGAGVVTGVAPGTALVAASANGPADTATVTVLGIPPVARVTAAPDSLVMAALGDYAYASAQAFDSTGTELTQGVYFAWSTPDTALIAVDPFSGAIIARAVGTARLVVAFTPQAPPDEPGLEGSRAAPGGRIRTARQAPAPRFTLSTTTVATEYPADTVLVRIYQDPRMVDIEPDTAIELNDPGDSYRPEGVVYDNNYHEIPGVRVAWESFDPSVATVDSVGTIRGVHDGSTTIRASYAGLTSDLSVTVRMVASVQVTPASPTLLVGDSVLLEPLAYDGSGAPIYGRRFHFTSSNTTVAIVDSLGKVHGMGVGTATIVAAQGTQGIGGQAAVSVDTVLRFALSHVSAGYGHTCALAPDRRAWCWGAGTHGELGNGDGTGSYSPRLVGPDGQFASISAGYDHTCALEYDSTGSGSDAYCWGNDDEGELGLGTQGGDYYTPNMVAGGLKWRSISAGYNTTCGVTVAGDAYCWGVNTQGEAGVAPSGPIATPTPVSGGHVWNAVAQGSGFACGLDSAGAAYCWGGNDSGQLGVTVGPTQTSIPVPLPGGHAFLHLALGLTHACAVDAGGAVWCWGMNGNGQLGAGDTATHAGVVKAASVETFANVGAGGSHTCAMTTAGALYCWGRGADGELGDNDPADRWQPNLVPGLSSVSEPGSGWWSHCAATSQNEGYCWGRNDFGQLGDGSTTSRPSPVPVLQGPAGPPGPLSGSRAPASARPSAVRPPQRVRPRPRPVTPARP
jgi:alpha-tubulin suppressor-like RCC1 family protein